MTVLNRDTVGVLTATSVALPENLKLKIFRDGFRTRFCEALLARRAAVVEGKTELIAYSAVARRAAELDPERYQRLDALGWVPFDAGSQTAVASFAAFFKGLGKTVATIFDQQLPAQRQAIEAACHAAFEQPYAGFENLLAAEFHVSMQAWCVKFFVGAGEWPAALNALLPPANSSDEVYRAAFLALFKHKKGDDHLTIFLDQCQVGHFPPTMIRVITALKTMLAPPPPPAQQNIFA